MVAKTERLVVEKALRVVPIDQIQFDPSYQRDVVPKHKKIVSDYHPEALGIPLVGEREDGSLWGVDGRQRMTALGKLGKKTVRCEVFRSRGPEHEAEVFRIVNQNRTKLRPVEIFSAALVAGDEAAWMVKGTVERCGFRIPKGQSRGATETPEAAARNLGCVQTLVHIGRWHGAEGLEFVVGTLARLWPNDKARVKTEIVTGIYAVWLRHEKNLDQDRLVARLATTTPSKILYSAQLGVGTRANAVADVMDRLYRKRYAKAG